MSRIHNKTYLNWLRKLFETTAVQYLFTSSVTSHRALVVSNISGNYQLHVVDFKTGLSYQVTNSPHGALFGSISPDGEYIYTLKDQSGGEFGHFARVLFGSKETINISPNLPPYFSYSVSTSIDNDILCFTAALEGKNKLFVVSCHQNIFELPKEIYTTTSTLSEPICSPDGKYVCVAETDSGKQGSTLLLLKSNTNNKSVYKRSRIFNALIPLAFSRTTDSPTIFALARRKGWYRPIRYDFIQKSVLEISHLSFRGDVWVLKLDEEIGTMILCDVYEATQTLYLYNMHTRRIKRIGPKVGSFNFHFDSVVTLKDSSLILKWHDFNHSPRLLKLNASRYDTWNKISQWSGNISTDYLIESVRFQSSDGELVQMWIARKQGAKNPTPFVIDVHGGPHGVTGDEYSPEAQAWLKAGFGYCAVNYRGSIGFGKKFEQKIYGNPGHWEVEDVVAARSWLVKKRYADPENVVLQGWSWGGYVTLLALGKYPLLWNCGIAGAAIADCAMQYEDEPAYFKADDKKRFKGTPTTARIRYVRSSPSTYVNQIQAPIFMIHGKNDTRCPPRQIKYFKDLLKKADKDVTVEWFTSGHIGGFTDTALRISLIEKSIKFAMHHLRSTKKENPSR
ncbi:MAG: hypothetical protein COV96_00305 [Candidatus Zambryskibacteria bacterium CG11_big_fil_rev_8_21_14_0_20_42_18]|uniref:Acyl-peptide hydrolase n=1 Tax=Candidatus Zambryskibacteria bacterium CG_4_9_14_3_um_filter_42_15 TaxID=1975112 RepID=A0A2M7WRE0_9BACT|nr:MAG: hypothetical protein COV96_00305 [Candidatus Zambryskibacteria bacterium CG11_big_fil_rev_8_21_14_0_20_42_18]PJA32571.1 MAG: hypothetical protein CO185_02520 [Candidatus Zambryskibacteria bacterium CG_4_9_14_3_um_filter_42_15]